MVKICFNIPMLHFPRLSPKVPKQENSGTYLPYLNEDFSQISQRIILVFVSHCQRQKRCLKCAGNYKTFYEIDLSNCSRHACILINNIRSTSYYHSKSSVAVTVFFPLIVPPYNDMIRNHVKVYPESEIVFYFGTLFASDGFKKFSFVRDSRLCIDMQDFCDFTSLHVVSKTTLTSMSFLSANWNHQKSVNRSQYLCFRPRCFTRQTHDCVFVFDKTEQMPTMHAHR